MLWLNSKDLSNIFFFDDANITQQVEKWYKVWTVAIQGFHRQSATFATNPCSNINARRFNKCISRVSNKGLFIYHFILFWPLLDPPSLWICTIALLPPFDSQHVRHDRLTYYFIKLITINKLFHTIIFGHHFKGVEELLNSLEWWNKSIFIQSHNNMVKLLYLLLELGKKRTLKLLE